MATKTWTSSSSTSFNTAGNWSDSAAPSNGDTLVFDSSSVVNCTTNLSSTLTGVTVIVEKSYTGQIGSVTAGVATPLILDGGTIRLPRGQGNGSPRLIFKNLADVASGSNPLTLIVEDSASSSVDGIYPPVEISGAALTVAVTGGSVAIAPRTGQSAILTSLRQGSNAGKVHLGQTVAITDATISAGTCFSRSDSTCIAMRVDGGTYEIAGDATHTTLNLDRGTVTWRGTGTITTLNCKGVFDASQDTRAKTITTMNTYKGSKVNLDNGVPGGITITNAINHQDGIGGNGCSLLTPPGTKGTYAAI